jgi:hypothetical protein
MVLSCYVLYLRKQSNMKSLIFRGMKIIRIFGIIKQKSINTI